MQAKRDYGVIWFSVFNVTKWLLQAARSGLVNNC